MLMTLLLQKYCLVKRKCSDNQIEALVITFTNIFVKMILDVFVLHVVAAFSVIIFIPKISVLASNLVQTLPIIVHLHLRPKRLI